MIRASLLSSARTSWVFFVIWRNTDTHAHTVSDKGGWRITIMYIHHALINALSAHMIHINLNAIFYTHVEHSPIKTVYIKYYRTHTHTAMNSNMYDTDV